MKKMQKINPFFLFGISLFVVVILYSLHYSLLYPSLSVSMAFFLSIVLVLSFISNIMWRDFCLYLNNCSDSQKQIHLDNKSKSLTIISLVGTLVEGIYSRGFPLLGHYSEGSSYGIPVVHVTLTVYISFLISLIFYFQVKKGFIKQRNILIMLNFFCLMLTLARSVLVVSLLNCLWIYLFSKKKIKIQKQTIIITIIGMYVFGLLGNYRSNMQQETRQNSIFNSDFVYYVGSAKENVRDKPLLGPLFWDYLYVTSPLANFQNIVNQKKVTTEKVSVSDIMSQFVSNAFIKEDNDPKTENIQQYQINSALTVGTIFFSNYNLSGWLGVWTMLIYMLIFPFFYILLIKLLAPAFMDIAISILDTLYVLNLFDNMFSFTTTSLLLLMPLFFRFIDSITLKKIRFI